MARGDIPPGAVVRISKGSFDPARFDEIEQMRHDVGVYLIPAITGLEGLIGYYAGTSRDGSVVDVSVWDSGEHADQMGKLKEMIVDARQASVALGITFVPIINYPISWHV